MDYLEDLPEVNHPTGRENFSVVTLPGIRMWFSYETCIAFRTTRDGLVVSENGWSRTTGKHLNYVDPAKRRRIPYSDFKTRLQQALGVAPNVSFTA